MDHFTRLTSLYLERAPEAQPRRAPERPPPPAPTPPSPPTRPASARYAEPLLAGIPRWRGGERRIARQLAEQQADEAYRLGMEAHELQLEAHRQRVNERQEHLVRLRDELAAEQRLLDRAHERLMRGDKNASVPAISAALKALPTTSWFVGWRADEAMIAVAAPSLEMVPEREPTFTSTGKPSTRKLNQTERHDLHAELVAAITLAAGHVATAASPGISGALVAALDDVGDVLAHCRVDRQTPLHADPVTTLYDADGDINPVGRTHKLTAVDIDGLRDVLQLANNARSPA